MAILRYNVTKHPGAGETCFHSSLRLERLPRNYCICHSKNNQYVGIWTPVTGMKMRFCDGSIRVNRQELDCRRKDETTKLRQFAEESEIVNNCLKP